MRVIHDIQCSWCGGREVTDCLTCNHESCDNCGVGGYCNCEPDKHAQITVPIKKELDRCRALIKEMGGEWIDRQYFEGKIIGLEFALRKVETIL
jgi:hypothetical protein